MKKHSWEARATLNSGPDDEGNDSTCIVWKCSECGFVAFTFGEGGNRPGDPDSVDARNVYTPNFKLLRDCEQQMVYLIMES